MAGAFDLLKAFPATLPALIALMALYAVVSSTMLRSRIRLARQLWQGKGTRRVALTVLAIRLGAHFALAAIGVTVSSVPAHLIFALVTAGLTVALLACTQRAAVRALTATTAVS